VADLNPSPPIPPIIRVEADLAALARAAADLLLEAALAAVSAGGRFSLVLSGGSTPRALYRRLADPSASYLPRIPWPQVHVFWGDERCVPPDHPESNYRMARESLLDRVPIPPGNVHRLEGEDPDPQAAAARYAEEIRRFFAPAPPRFDFLLLGLGADAHTASLFPGTDALEDRSWVAAPWVDKLTAFRLTLTPALLNRAAQVIFLVAGADKAAAVAAVLGGRPTPLEAPARVIQPVDGEVLWLLDAEAASRLDPRKTDWRG
jgi:6-phosphogluconolactonase